MFVAHGATSKGRNLVGVLFFLDVFIFYIMYNIIDSELFITEGEAPSAVWDCSPASESGEVKKIMYHLIQHEICY